MGNPMREGDGNVKKRGRRGSTDNNRRLDAFRKGIGSATADWGGCDAARLRDIVVAITELGGAATFGLSRDGGAYMMTIMLDGARETLWFNGSSELDDELLAVLETLKSVS